MQLTRSSSFRTATLADAPELAEMNHRLIHDEGHRNPMTVEELRVRMQGWLRGEHEAAVFEQDGRIAGYALFQRQPEHVYLPAPGAWTGRFRLAEVAPVARRARPP
jgi:hypothetical protein